MILFLWVGVEVRNLRNLLRKEEENDKYYKETDIHRNGRNGGFNKAICGSPQMRGTLGGGYSAAYGFNSDSHRIEKH